MNVSCPSCHWPSPALLSSHRSVHYLRCVCGRWLVVHDGEVVAAAGAGQFAAAATGPDEPAAFRASDR
ncbi:hypothetical protein [Nocardia blacklockiae]|uniref:hypothetical protein n=1 Tax=Nocardia blacklockiae TaxID=480036 RepID=UPI001893517E|nr:hypothetical protein [Nocardia blacklockiae]MBF6171793.1 hypothetical protein [Nocardia blacklockiae]